MSPPDGTLWVDPEGVSSVGDSYAEHADHYKKYLAEIADMRIRYQGAWGNDDMGKAFSAKFLAGMDSLEGVVKGVLGGLEYTAEGLRGGGKSYREADDGAADAAKMLSRRMGAGAKPTASPPSGAGAGDVGLTPRTRAAATTAGGTSEGAEAHDGKLTPPSPDVSTAAIPAGTVTDGPTAPHTLDTAATPAGVVSDGAEARDGKLTPPIPDVSAAATPAGALTDGPTPGPCATGAMTTGAPAAREVSAHRVDPAYAEAHVGGKPIPDGYHLRAFIPVSDGSVCLDASPYDSISPLDSGTVTDPDGRKLDPGEGRFFLVQDNPIADASTPARQPLYVEFPPRVPAVNSTATT